MSGGKVEDRAQNQTVDAAKKFNPWPWIGVVVLVIIVGVAVYYYSNSMSNKKEEAVGNENIAEEKVSLNEDWQISSEIMLPNKTSTDTHKLADGTFRMYQMDQSGIYYADSVDCLTFGAAQPTGITEDAGKMISNPAVVEVSTGDWIMIYEMAPMRQPGQQGNTATSSATQRNLYLATSTNGKNFSKVGIAIDSSKEDNYFASVPDLIKTADGKIRMYYVSRGDSIGSALSSDGGRTWVRESGFRLTNMAVDPDVSCKTTAGNTSCVMYYTVLDPQRNGIYKAISSDGLKWTELGKLFSATTSGAVVDADVVEVSPTNHVMFLGQSEIGDSTGGETINLYRAELDKSIY